MFEFKKTVGIELWKQGNKFVNWIKFDLILKCKWCIFYITKEKENQDHLIHYNSVSKIYFAGLTG